jgi:LysM repeat protein
MSIQLPGSATRATVSPPAASNQSSGPTSPTPDTSPTKAWADALAQAKANSPQPYVKARPGDSLSSIASRYNDTLTSVEEANPQIHCQNLIKSGETVYLPKTAPAQVVTGVDNSQIKPIITSMAGANLVDQGLQDAARSHVRDPELIAEAQAQSTKSWNAVERTTFNMLMENNVRAFPEAAAAAEVRELNALEPGNAKFAAANDAALAEATQKWTQMGVTKSQLGPIIDAYNNARQTTDSVNQYLQNPHLPHSRVVVDDLNAAEQQANAQLDATIENSLREAAHQAGDNATARAAAIAERAHNIETFGPHNPAFRSAVENAENASASLAYVGWQPPTDWNAKSLPGSSHPGTDPFNIIISGDSNVTLQQLVGGLEAVPGPAGAPVVPPGVEGRLQRQWAPVPISNSFINPGTGPEDANVQPQGQGGREVQQQLSMRVGGTRTELWSNINHFRLYQQERLPGDHQSAYFIAASLESFHFDWLTSIRDATTC